MGKLLLVIFMILILILDFAALDDITTGNEPNLTEEYIILFISIPILIFLGFLLWKRK